MGNFSSDDLCSQFGEPEDEREDKAMSHNPETVNDLWEQGQISRIKTQRNVIKLIALFNNIPYESDENERCVSKTAIIPCKRNYTATVEQIDLHSKHGMGHNPYWKVEITTNTGWTQTELFDHIDDCANYVEKIRQ